uniref:Protein white n=1 Tax=Tigriopus japonicus TaxID=158387 RepID=A0A0A7AS64_TIGJA|nr:ATP-binding cassette transporter sub-family G 90506 [Tigriopus japonicus]
MENYAFDQNEIQDHEPHVQHKALPQTATPLAINRGKKGRTTSLTVQNEQITFSWEGITVQTSSSNNRCFGFKRRLVSEPKKILKNVSGFVKPGQLVAIMGASGAGKSTLINSLTYRNLNGLEIISGTRYANGVVVNPNSLTAVSGYVQQDDLFIGTLSVREQLEFQALVRMESQIPKSTRMEMVDAVIQELGLEKCQNQIIGVPGKLDGISGGEMKRLAFACEVLTNPSLLFCDEPTTGLDSYMAQNVVQVLRALAAKGKTIVCTIHQPSSQVFALFDRILLMAEGRLAYIGDLAKAAMFFDRIGLPCPDMYNPADHYIHVLAVTPGKEDECRTKVKEICDLFENSLEGKHVFNEVQNQKNNVGSIPNLGNGNESGKVSPYRASWMEQFKALLWRSWLSVIKNPSVTKVRFVQTLLISLVLGLIYLNQELSQEGVMNINGALFLLLTNMTFMNLFTVMNVFSMELPIFLREHFNGMYRVDVYYICKQLAELPVFLVFPILFVSIYYWMVGLNPLAGRFFVTMAIATLLAQVVISFGYFISCVTPSLSVALALAPPLTIPIMLFGGFFLNFEAIPKWLGWLQYLSWFKYGNEILVINQWKGVALNCTERCNFETGQDVIDFYNFNEDNYGFDIAMLVVMTILFRILGFLALLARTYQKQI